MRTYEGIMKGLEDAVEHAEGKQKLRTSIASAIVVEPVKEYEPGEIKGIRVNLGMTQVIFAGYMGVSPKTVEAWEAGRNMPDGPARRLLSLTESNPTITKQIVSNA